MTYGFQDNVSRAFNLTPAEADRAITEAYELAGGKPAFDWYAAEQRLLTETFHGNDAPTELELQFLVELARAADHRGQAHVTRDALAAALRCTTRDVGAAINWGIWRGSFSFFRTSAKGDPPAYRFTLRDWSARQAPGSE
ncbi:hypothetical protein ACTJJ4_07890 [Microbacterium sp. 22195]|uniref:hypothetical protein n=1 Tax=Microbacterium sp. 22195 TaxID=3453891 RepID=UPI003F879433